MNKEKILKRLREKISAGRPIIGGGAGTGISAKCEEAGGIDLIIIYNSGRYRMAGRGSLAGLLAYGNANEIVVEMGKEVLPVVKNTPVLAGVNATDPFIGMESFLKQLWSQGFSGVQNFPTVGLIDGVFRENLEETGMSYSQEVDMISMASDMDLITTPYVFNVDDAAAMAKAGADIIVCHMGLTTAGSIGAQTAKTLTACVELINTMADVIKRINSEAIILCHGGPIAMPEDAQFILSRCPEVGGFYGASSMERLPTEVAIKEQVEAFCNLTISDKE